MASCGGKRPFPTTLKTMNNNDIERLRLAGERIEATCLSFDDDFVSTPKVWKCKKCGREWNTTIYNIEKNNGCLLCSRRRTASRRAHGPDEYDKLAKAKGLVWIGPAVTDSKSMTAWRCENAHQWETSYNSILKNGSCPHCAGLARKGADAYRRLAREHGFEWLGPEVSNTKTKTTWECSNGHRWKARYNDIHNGFGCSHCQDMVNGQHVSQPQRDLCNMVNGRLNYPCGRLNIDVAMILGDIKIAIEYDCWYWHKEKQEQDAQRDKKLIAAGWRILRIKSRTKLPTHAQLFGQIANLMHGQTYAEIILDDWGATSSF